MIEERHIAVVKSTSDPEKRGRIKVSCASLLGDEDSDAPMWIEPVLTWGSFIVPDVGETVEIVIDAHGETDESFAATSIENPRPRWYGARYFQRSESEQGHRAIPADFKVNYGKRRGFATPAGHIVIFDDTLGSELVSISCKVSLGTVSISLNANGSALISDPLGSSIELDGAGTIKIDGTIYTQIGGAGAASLAKNLQVLSAFTALGIGIAALPPGPVTALDLQTLYSTFLGALPAVLLGTLRGGMA
jgi:hypothetical protein